MTTPNVEGQAPAAVQTDTPETVTTNVDPALVARESERRKFDDERKAFTAEKDAWEAGKQPKEPTRPTSFSVDEALDDPFTYFATHGADEETVFQLAQSVFFNKYPDKAPPDFQMNKTKRQVDRSLKKLEEKTAELETKAEETYTKQKQAEYEKQVFGEFRAAADSLSAEGNEDNSYSRAFFDDSDDYLRALINTAKNVAGELKRPPTIKEVQDSLEKWLESKYTRHKPKAVATEVKAPPQAKQLGQTLSVADTQIERRSPMTAQERFENAMKVAETNNILKKDVK